MDGGSVANRTVAVALKAEIGQYVAGMSKASAATMRLGESAREAHRRLPSTSTSRARAR
jgi:hypothetical protein